MIATNSRPRSAINFVARSNLVADFCGVTESDAAALPGTSPGGGASSSEWLSGSGKAAGVATFAFCLLPPRASAHPTPYFALCLLMLEGFRFRRGRGEWRALQRRAG